MIEMPILSDEQIDADIKRFGWIGEKTNLLDLRCQFKEECKAQQKEDLRRFVELLEKEVYLTDAYKIVRDKLAE